LDVFVLMPFIGLVQARSRDWLAISPSDSMTKRRHSRAKGVLPVKVSGADGSGIPFQEIAHTLDITPNGARLGALRRRLEVEDRVMVQYRQRKIEFRVVWIKSLKDTNEYQVGLQTVARGDAWRL
jgi:PilZ domain